MVTVISNDLAKLDAFSLKNSSVHFRRLHLLYSVVILIIYIIEHGLFDV